MPKTTLIDCCIKKYAYREVSQIYQELEISEEGLSQSQVELMREKYGINRFSKRRNDTMLRLLRRAFINPFNSILLVLYKLIGRSFYIYLLKTPQKVPICTSNRFLHSITASIYPPSTFQTRYP